MSRGCLAIMAVALRSKSETYSLNTVLRGLGGPVTWAGLTPLGTSDPCVNTKYNLASRVPFFWRVPGIY